MEIRGVAGGGISPRSLYTDSSVAGYLNSERSSGRSSERYTGNHEAELLGRYQQPISILAKVGLAYRGLFEAMGFIAGNRVPGDKQSNKVEIDTVGYKPSYPVATTDKLVTSRVCMEGELERYTGGKKPAPHKGLDFRSRVNGKDADVLSFGPGRVVHIGTVKDKRYPQGYGNIVFVEHLDGKVSSYAHMSNIDVKIGQRVTGAEKLGVAGDIAGPATKVAPHLHFELFDRWAGSYLAQVALDRLDPTSIFRKYFPEVGEAPNLGNSCGIWGVIKGKWQKK